MIVTTGQRGCKSFSSSTTSIFSKLISSTGICFSHSQPYSKQISSTCSSFNAEFIVTIVPNKNNTLITFAGVCPNFSASSPTVIPSS